MTTQATHTPGPWRPYENPSLEPDNAHAIGVTMDRDVRNDVAACNLLGLDLDECKANARLIAAAPDLLEALRELMKCAVRDAEKYAPEDNAPIWAYISDASDAICKAEGRASE